ncbi:MAG: DNA topoisomerase IB, partial [Flavobacteriaceae bacterium]
MPGSQAKPEHDKAGRGVSAARSASLVYCSDADPGIRRIRSGRGFRYVGADGGKLRDPAALGRIRALSVPPAWDDVWIAPASRCHLQATGRDARGRKQYIYHQRWSTAQGEAKFATLAEFAAALPALRARIDADLARRGTCREKVLASIVWLLDHAMIRIGNEAYERDNGSFGLTTLRRRHVDIDGSTLRFAFTGKSGREWKLRIADRRIARIVRSIQELPGQRLFQYVDADGARHPVHSQDVNDYIRAAAGDGFTSKHFRTWGATVRAAGLLAGARFANAPRTARILNRAIDAVAAQLGNTRAVCRSSYIHPRVIEAWRDGALADDLTDLRRRYRRTPGGLDRDEAIL